MGAGQSKTETLFDRYPDNEIVKDIKLTPTMVNQINNAVGAQPEIDVEALKVFFFNSVRSYKFCSETFDQK